MSGDLAGADPGQPAPAQPEPTRQGSGHDGKGQGAATAEDAGAGAAGAEAAGQDRAQQRDAGHVAAMQERAWKGGAVQHGPAGWDVPWPMSCIRAPVRRIAVAKATSRSARPGASSPAAGDSGQGTSQPAGPC